MKDAKLVAEQFPWHDKWAYSQHLAHCYFNTRHSCSLIAISAARFNLKNEILQNRSIKHLQQEHNHEKLAKSDYLSLGFSEASMTEAFETSVLYQQLYYQIERVNPVCIWGPILMLEGWSAFNGPYIYNEIVKAHGKDKAKFRKIHKDNDNQHLDEAFEALASVTGEEDLLISNAMEQYSYFFLGLHKKIAKEVDLKNSRKAG